MSLSLIEAAQYESAFDYLCKYSRPAELERIQEEIERDEAILEIKKKVIKTYLKKEE